MSTDPFVRLVRVVAILLVIGAGGLVMLTSQRARLLDVRPRSPRPNPGAGAPITPPTHPMLFGYFYADGRYGDHLDAVANTTNAYVACPTCFDTAQDWRGPLRAGLDRARAASHAVILIAGDPGLWTDLLEVVAPYWSAVAFVEIAHEARLRRGAMNDRIREWRARVEALQLDPKPVAALQSSCQTWGLWRCVWWNDWTSPELDLVGLEAYLPIPAVDPEPSGLPRPVDYQAANVEQNVQAILSSAEARIAPAQRLYVVTMAYDRNGNWKQRDVLPGIQRATYDWARSRERVAALLPFAYARPGGVRGDAHLTAVLQNIGLAIRQGQ